MNSRKREYVKQSITICEDTGSPRYSHGYVPDKF